MAHFAYPFKHPPFQHQLAALARGWEEENFAYFMEMGCVDAETQYLSPEGWKKISEYSGGQVAQFNLDGTAEFVTPELFLKKPCAEMHHFTSARGLDQMLSPDHRMLVLKQSKTRKSPNDQICKEIAAGPGGRTWCETTPTLLNENTGIRVKVWPVFEGCHGDGLDLSDTEIRIQVAFHADGSYGTRDISSVTGRRNGALRLKHRSKVKRIVSLLETAEYEYSMKERGNGFVSVGFRPPLVSKKYGKEWWGVSRGQKEVILDEVFRWDGNRKDHNSRSSRGSFYSSVHREDAEFIQFCAVSTGRRASVRKQSDGTWMVRLVGSGRTGTELCLNPRTVEMVPSPDGHMYCFKVPSSYLVLRRNGCVFTSGNTGKTKTTIDNMAMLFDAGRIEGALVLAPKGVYSNWTDKEIPEHIPEHIPLRIAKWTTSGSKKKKQELDAMFEINQDFSVLVMNIESFVSRRAVQLAEKFLISRKAMMVIDESTTIKTPSAKRTKQAIILGRFAKYRRILTGSPVTKSPLDLYSQCEFLSPRLLGHKSYYAFRGRYAQLQPQNFGGRVVQQVVGFKNLEQLNQQLQEFSFRVTKDECLDLPKKIYMKREIELSKEQQKAYDEMRQFAMVELTNTEATVTTVLTQILRLHQITCGHLPMDDGTMHELPSSRLSELMSTLEEISGKVIIWANYRHDIKLIKDAVAKKYGEKSLVTYFGDTKEDERKQAVLQFQDEGSPVRFFIGNTQTGGYGITLTAAQTVIYYSNNFDLEKRIQSEDRAHRIGQNSHVTYVDIVAKNTVDEKIIQALRNKVSLARAVTGDAWKEWI